MTPRMQGFHKLRPGRIHLRCPGCNRKMSNTLRANYDPPRAVLVETHCDKCGIGDKEAGMDYYDEAGKLIEFDEIDAHVDAVVKAEAAARRAT